MKKRIFAVITLIAMMMFAGCGKSEPVNDPVGAPINSPKTDLTSTSAENSFEVNPPFFKVTDESTGAVVYMLGSMHVGKPEATYPQKLCDALDECDTLAVEVDIQALEADIMAAAEAMRLMRCPSGKTVKDYMGSDYDEIVRKFTEKGLYSPLYEQYIPALWSSLWSNQMAAECGYDSNCGTDMLLLSYAKEHGKKIDEIESAKEQYQVEANISPKLQMLTLNQTLELSKDEIQEQFDALYNAWRSADMEALEGLVSEEEEDESLTEELKAEYDRYYDDMYANRQKKMAEYVMSKLKSGGKTFVVVGALHYAAPPSIRDILTENGYTIETLSTKA